MAPSYIETGAIMQNMLFLLVLHTYFIGIVARHRTGSACGGIAQKRLTRPKHQRQHLKFPPTILRSRNASRQLFSLVFFPLCSMLSCYMLRSKNIFFVFRFSTNIENSFNFFLFKFCTPPACILIYSLSNQVGVVAQCKYYWLIYENEWKKWNRWRIK